MDIEVGLHTRPCLGEDVNGDGVYQQHDGDEWLFVVFDGLGHGPDAAEAVEVGCKALQECTTGEPGALLQLLHQAMRGTRGAAAAVLSIDTARAHLRFAGVGNILVMSESVEPVRPLSRPGVIGYRLGKIMVQEFELSVNDLVVSFTDGVSSRATLEGLGSLPTEEVARRLVREHGKDHDDATALALRFRDVQDQ